jgi:putative transmembrane protein PGPGW
MMAS